MPSSPTSGSLFSANAIEGNGGNGVDGGPLSGHHSHQSGRYIDVGLYYARVP